MPWKVGIIVLMFPMKELRLGEVKQLAPGQGWVKGET